MLCQRCRLPLIQHESFNELTSTQRGILLTDRNDRRLATKTNTKFASPSDSFVMLTESLMAGNSSLFLDAASDYDTIEKNGGATTGNANAITSVANRKDRGNLSKQIQKTENIFENISGKSDLDYPVCPECAELILKGLKPRYEESCKERDTYISFLNKIKDLPGVGSDEIKEIENDIVRLESEIDSALKQLIDAENEKNQAELELQQLEAEVKDLELEEHGFFREQNKIVLALEQLNQERQRLEMIDAHQRAYLQKLHRVNVYNDSFCIGHDGYFGTINGLRLGRLRDKRVEWSEINAAWGQVLLLIATVTQKLDFKINGYRLRPLGSTSRIEKLPPPGSPPNTKPTVLELYSSGDYTIERILNYKRIDAAMVAFLDILNQVGMAVFNADPSQKRPYAIEKDKIGGHSIRLSISTTNESWTTACKYVLTNAKLILAYASSRSK